MNITRAIVESGFELVELLVKDGKENIFVSRDTFASLLKGRDLRNKVKRHCYSLGPDENIEEYVFQSPIFLSFHGGAAGNMRA